MPFYDATKQGSTPLQEIQDGIRNQNQQLCFRLTGAAPRISFMSG
jgi:hypothetical protein